MLRHVSSENALNHSLSEMSNLIRRKVFQEVLTLFLQFNVGLRNVIVLLHSLIIAEDGSVTYAI